MLTWAAPVLLVLTASTLGHAFVPGAPQPRAWGVGPSRLASRGLVGGGTRPGRPLLSSGATTDTREKAASELPYPVIGDIVRYPGKWEGDYGIGQIRFLQRIQSRDAWIADIAPFKDVSDDQYRAQKGGGLLTHDVTLLAPLSAFYIGSTDAFKVMHKTVNGTRVPVTMSAGYKTEGFTLTPRKIDMAAVEKARGEYNELKIRILKDTGIFGAAGTLLCAVNAGPKDAGVFALGVAASLAYLALLQLKADAIGAPGSDSSPASKLGTSRFLVPVALIAGLAAKHAGDANAHTFNYIPQDEFWSGTLGFLSYRVPMLAREVSEIVQRRASDSGLPMGGTARAGAAVLEKLGGKGTKKADGPIVSKSTSYRDEVTVLLISGPPGMNKRALAARLVKEDPLERFAAPVWVTTRDPRAGEADGVDFHFMEDFAFQVMKEQGRFLVFYQDEQGAWYGLRPSDVTDVTSKKGRASVLALDAFAADKLLTLDGARLIAVWVTMNTVDQLKDRYRALLPSTGLSPEEKDARVEQALVKATADIEHGLLDAGYYEYTIYDDEGPEATWQKLRDFADFALTL